MGWKDFSPSSLRQKVGLKIKRYAEKPENGIVVKMVHGRMFYVFESTKLKTFLESKGLLKDFDQGEFVVQDYPDDL
jgi:hypothetical protein